MLKVAVLVGFASGATMAAMTLAGVLIGVACYELCERPLRRVNSRAAAGS